MVKMIVKTMLQMMALAAVICSYSSCSGDDYINAIPGNSNALIAVDIENAAKQSQQDNGKLIESLFHVKDISDCGINMGSKLYFFETTDGNIGCCAKVDDESKLQEWLNKLAGEGFCNKVTERREICYTMLRGSWAVCFNNKALLITGPVLPAQLHEAVRTMARCLKQKEDNGIKGTPIFDRIEGMESSVSMVATVDALPDKIAAPFTIGAPKGADGSQILVAASMQAAEGGCLKIVGESFSFNKQVDNELKKGTAKFRKMNGKYINNLPNNTLCSIFMNVDGKEFVKMMHNSDGLGMLLAGMNTAIDMDNILKSVNGDMVIGIDSYAENDIRLTMAAQLDNANFLKDVGYWKKSCPSGSSIVDCGKNSFCFKNGNSNFWFGVAGNKEFYGSTNEQVAYGILKPSSSPLSAALRKEISGERFCMTLNVEELLKGNDELSVVTDMLTPLFGKINNVIYCIK